MVRLNLPEALTIDHIGTMRQDLAEILRIATDEPDALVELHSAALRNDFPAVNRLAERIGLTEAKLSAPAAASSARPHWSRSSS